MTHAPMIEIAEPRISVRKSLCVAALFAVIAFITDQLLSGHEQVLLITTFACLASGLWGKQSDSDMSFLENSEEIFVDSTTPRREFDVFGSASDEDWSSISSSSAWDDDFLVSPITMTSHAYTDVTGTMWDDEGMICGYDSTMDGLHSDHFSSSFDD